MSKLTTNSSNLTSIVDFPIRIQNYSSTVISDIFVGSCRKDCIYIEPVIDGLSDHDAKLLVIRNIESILNYNYEKQTRLINNDTAGEFTTHLSNVNWKYVLSCHDVD
jgi:hypothetical protein